MIDQQKQEEICGSARIGCDRETACQIACCTPAALREALAADADFERRLRRAEAAAEVHHMRVIHKASHEDQQWRASVWWLERRAPERFARKAETITASDFSDAFSILTEIIATEVHDHGDRKRLLVRIEDLQQDMAMS